MNSIAQTLQSASQRLQSQQVSDSPKLDAELLLCHCLGKNRTYLFTWPEKILQPKQQTCFEALLKQRLQGHPIAHLIGQREFWGLNLKVTPDTLIPRPDTEILVETALEKLPAKDFTFSFETGQACPKPHNQTCRILDLGTGSGAIALALKHERPDCQVTAVDLSPAALQVAQYNAQTLELEIDFKPSSWFSGLSESAVYDLIVSNPPYIEDEDEHLQHGDVRFEPLSALTSGKDGLNDLKTIIQQACPFLTAGGWLIVEHGYNQASAVQALFNSYGYVNVCSRQDYAGNDRITLGQIRALNETSKTQNERDKPHV
ncbi:peptide chain release factor N(5)-glutamine methyltransferase [Thiomicrorhabdus chilensis]|uniref:peptide chain release factor N(5)-glutamine methyltransferase n=1 Tax=Thiomicrorhabdus chilensis TaxID=63656 RepID=UPI0004260F7A|nr:peptide chain release factor N(5)-glutamine methyltransferase [Thiomicrorhabdus chilensis]